MTLERLRDRLAEANPVPDEGRLHERPEFVDAFLLLIKERSGIVDTKPQSSTSRPIIVEPDETAAKPSWWKRGRLAIAVVVAVGLVAAIAVVALLADRPEEITPVTQPPPVTEATSAPTTQATSDTVTPAGALAVNDAYFEAFNAGDAEAVMALFTPDVTFRSTFTGESTRTEEEMRIVWNTAQGTTLPPPDCTVTENAPGTAAFVNCESGTHSAEAQAIGAPPVHTTTAMTVTPDGISRLVYGYGQPDFNHVAVPFHRWVESSHPEDVDKVGFGNWTSVEEAEQNGLLTAQYADEWAAFLDAKDCVYPDACYRLP